MPSLSTLVLYAGTAVLILLVPGPAVLYIVSQGLRHGRRAAVPVVLGIHTGTLVQAAACAVGLSWLLLSSSLAFTVVKYAGAAYLIYLGVRRLCSRTEFTMVEAGMPRSVARMYGEGVLVNILNPKLALFFLAFLPQFVDPARGSIGGQVAMLGVVFVLIGLCTDGAFALLAGTVGPWLGRSGRFLRGERYVVGGTFIGLGIVAAFTPARQSHS